MFHDYHYWPTNPWNRDTYEFNLYGLPILEFRPMKSEGSVTLDT